MPVTEIVLNDDNLGISEEEMADLRNIIKKPNGAADSMGQEESTPVPIDPNTI